MVDGKYFDAIKMGVLKREWENSLHKVMGALIQEGSFLAMVLTGEDSVRVILHKL